jgi:DNA-binding transcriptional LysR family regulator
MKPDISYPKLRAFYYVARYGSARKAAQALFVTEGAISQQIADLERRLQKRLFVRLQRKTTLTSDGINLLKLVTPLVERCENIGLEFERIAGTLGEKLGLHPGQAWCCISYLNTLSNSKPRIRNVISYFTTSLTNKSCR